MRGLFLLIDKRSAQDKRRHQVLLDLVADLEGAAGTGAVVTQTTQVRAVDAGTDMQKAVSEDPRAAPMLQEDWDEL